MAVKKPIRDPKIGGKLLHKLTGLFFPGSDNYWEQRYRKGGTSGAGSYGEQAHFKAETLNHFVAQHNIHSIIEFGCGDGNQLSLATYPQYIGLDVSKEAVALCHNRFAQDPSKSFYLYHPLAFVDNHQLFQADLALSLDVLYHLVEDDIYTMYLKHLFATAKQYVIIYASNHDSQQSAAHVRHRAFMSHVQQQYPNWHLLETIHNPDKKVPIHFHILSRERGG